MSAAVGQAEVKEALVLRLQETIRAKKRWWQNVRLEVLAAGINAYVELKPELSFIPELLGITPHRAILSVLAERVPSLCVMLDGVEHSKKWFTDLDEAVSMLTALV